jgi:hypothetical protein
MYMLGLEDILNHPAFHSTILEIVSLDNDLGLYNIDIGAPIRRCTGVNAVCNLQEYISIMKNHACFQHSHTVSLQSRTK